MDIFGNNQTKGLVFPVTLLNGSSQLTEGTELIKASIKVIISWPLRTRVFNGYFGSRIEEVLEEPNDNVLITIIRKFIIDSLAIWEKRIELISISIYRPQPEKVVFNLVYKIKDLNIQDSLFYEYYIE